MKFGGICIETANAPRLAEFYKALLQEEPFVEGEHYAFQKIAVYNPGGVRTATEKNIWLSFSDEDIDGLYKRLLLEIPHVEIVSPPERKEWGAYSFWLLDPDGNKITVYEAQ